MLVNQKHLVVGDGECCILNVSPTALSDSDHSSVEQDEFKEICSRGVDVVEALVGCKSVYVCLLNSGSFEYVSPFPFHLPFIATILAGFSVKYSVKFPIRFSHSFSASDQCLH